LTDICSIRFEQHRSGGGAYMDNSNTQPPDSSTPDKIIVSAFYHSAVNAVTKPDKFTHTSHYFIDRWMPLLGGNGTLIVLALRRVGFLNRKTGELRDEIAIDGVTLAEAAGMSEDTLIRELVINKKTGKPQNEWLSHFVKKRQRQRRNKAGLIRQAENAYWVAMDDPIHPDDWHLVTEAAQEAEDRTQKYSGPPNTQIADPVNEAIPQSAEVHTQSAVNHPQSTDEKPHFAYHLNLYSSIQKNTLVLPGTPPLPLPREGTPPSAEVRSSDQIFSLSFQETEPVKVKEPEQDPDHGRKAIRDAKAWLKSKQHHTGATL
jgi:hypothetical protein